MSEFSKLEELLHPEDVGKMLGISAHTVTKLAKTKRLPAIKIGNKWLFCKIKIEKFISEKMEEV